MEMMYMCNAADNLMDLIYNNVFRSGKETNLEPTHSENITDFSIYSEEEEEASNL